jgi:uncharacterized membrane protein YfcA
VPTGEDLWILIAQLAGIGAAAGLLGGMLGIGGGIVMITAMTILLGQRFGPESFHLYKLASITTTIALSIPAIMRHRQARAIVPGMLWSMVPAAVLGVLAGVALSSVFVREHTLLLRRGFGVFLECVVLFNLYQSYAGLSEESGSVRRCPMPSRWKILAGVVGIPMGFLGGFLGIGGGVWAVPSQRLVLGVKIRSAIANSAATILPVAVTTSLVHAYAITQRTELHVSDAYWLALVLAPTALVMAWIGAALTHTVPVKTLKQAFQILLAVAGLRLILG